MTIITITYWWPLIMSRLLATWGRPRWAAIALGSSSRWNFRKATAVSDSRKQRDKNVRVYHCHYCCPFNLLLVLKFRANHNFDSKISFRTHTHNTSIARTKVHERVQMIRCSPNASVTPAWCTILLRYISVFSNMSIRLVESSIALGFVFTY